MSDSRAKRSSGIKSEIYYFSWNLVNLKVSLKLSDFVHHSSF